MLSIASIAATQASMRNGVLRGRRSNPGGSQEIVAGRLAVQNAATDGVSTLSAGVGVQVTAVPRLALPLKNCTVPVGPCAELLLVLTFALKVTLPPDTTVNALGVTTVVVVAWMMVTDRLLLVFGLGAV
jgi:hypothetical protein